MEKGLLGVAWWGCKEGFQPEEVAGAKGRGKVYLEENICLPNREPAQQKTNVLKKTMGANPD
jgi:hypothetical protein